MTWLKWLLWLPRRIKENLWAWHVPERHFADVCTCPCGWCQRGHDSGYDWRLVGRNSGM